MDVEAILALLVPISAVVLGIGVVFWRIYWEHQRKRMEYEERRLLIEKGMELPPMLPDTVREGRWTPHDSLRRGLTMIFLGIGLAIAYLVISRPGSPMSGNWPRFLALAAPIVGFLGVGHLAYYWLVPKTTTAEPARDSPVHP
jgi:hypothetical protein